MKKARSLLLVFLATWSVCEAQHLEKAPKPYEPVFSSEIRRAEEALSKGEVWEVSLTNANCKIGELVSGLDYVNSKAALTTSMKAANKTEEGYKVNVTKGTVTYLKTGSKNEHTYSSQTVRIGNVTLNNVVCISTSDVFSLSADLSGETYNYRNNYYTIIDPATQEEICSFIFVYRNVAGLLSEFKTVVVNEKFKEKLNYQSKGVNEQLARSYSIPSRLSFHPNPADDIVYFSIDVLKSRPVGLTILDINGRLVATVVANQTLPEGLHKFELNTSQYPRGIYVVKFTNNASISESKLILK